MLSLLPRRCGEARHLSSLQLKPWLQMFQDHGESEHLQLGSNKSNDRNLCLCFCKIKSAFPLLQSEKPAQALKHYRNQLHNNFVPGVQNALGKAKPKKKKKICIFQSYLITTHQFPPTEGRGKHIYLYHLYLCLSMQLLSHVWLCYAMDCTPPGSNVCGILQARIL